ncbi:MAG: GerMN domain-containing protein [Spirochaetales bacterium]|nr:GerMN domain-containing protein [Spirochaetales bacterium]
MAKKTIDPSLKKKYGTGGTKQSPAREKSGRNLGLLSLFFILLSLVLVVGKLTLEGKLAADPPDSPASLPVVTRMEEKESTSPQKASLAVEKATPQIDEESIKKEDEPKEETEPEETPLKEYQTRLFFLKINDEGQILLKSIMRNIQYEEGLLAATLSALLDGPSQDDLMKGYFTLIPNETVINKISLRDGIAWIDVNDAFRYNHLGFEGYQAQLKQLVYSATEFSSVVGVKITINGSEEDFLNAEGINISGILTRDSFQ